MRQRQDMRMVIKAGQIFCIDDRSDQRAEKADSCKRMVEQWQLQGRNLIEARLR